MGVGMERWKFFRLNDFAMPNGGMCAGPNGDWVDADEAETAIAKLEDKLRETSAALADAQREIEELRADRDRLDFILEHYAHVRFRVDRFDPEERVLVDVWTVDCGDIYPRGINGPKHEMAIEAGTLRDAIDAAMEADRAIREARRGE